MSHPRGARVKSQGGPRREGAENRPNGNRASENQPVRVAGACTTIRTPPP